jgi:hypothetical protein
MSTWLPMGGLRSGEKRNPQKSSSVGGDGAEDLVTRRAIPPGRSENGEDALNVGGGLALDLGEEAAEAIVRRS